MANRQGFQIERVPMKNTHHEKKYELLVSNSERIAWAAWGQAELGVFLCFEEPTKPMLREAAEAGLYKSSDGTTYPAAADSDHPADSGRAAAGVSAAPARRDVQEGSAQPSGGGGKPEVAAAAGGVAPGLKPSGFWRTYAGVETPASLRFECFRKVRSRARATRPAESGSGGPTSCKADKL